MDCNEARKRVYRIDRFVHPSLILITPEPESHPPKWRPFLEPPESTTRSTSQHSDFLRIRFTQHPVAPLSKSTWSCCSHGRSQDVNLEYSHTENRSFSLPWISEQMFWFSRFFFKCLWQVLPKPWKKSASVDTSAVFSLLKNGTLSAPVSCRADSTNRPMMSWPYLGDFLEQTVRYPWYPTLHGKLKNNVYQRGVVISHSEIHWWYSICITIMVRWTWKPPGSSFSSVLAIFRHTCQTLGDRRVAQTYGGFHTWMIPSINGWFKKWMII